MPGQPERPRHVPGPAAAPDSDADLLDRFVRERDEGAFACLLRRHGGLVLGVCRRLLRDHHEAEDAFQAAWLVFARKAAGVRPGGLVAWLHGVARQVSRNALRAAARRRRGSQEMLAEPAARPRRPAA